MPLYFMPSFSLSEITQGEIYTLSLTFAGEGIFGRNGVLHGIAIWEEGPEEIQPSLLLQTSTLPITHARSAGFIRPTHTTPFNYKGNFGPRKQHQAPR